MLDFKERIWGDVHNLAFSVFCPACGTVFKPKVDDTVGRAVPEGYFIKLGPGAES